MTPSNSATASPVPYRELISRNIGIVSPDEQEAISEAEVLMAGIGAEGGAVATCLVRLGFRHLRIADVDSYDASNLNRQFGAYADTIGMSKVEGLAAELRRINPDVDLREIGEGVTPGNVGDLIEGVDCVVNGMDLFVLDAHRALDAAVREAGLIMVGAASVGLRSDLYAYHPGGMGVAEYIDRTFAAGRFPWIPAEADLPPSTPPDLVRRVIERELPAPVVAPAVFLTGARVATAVLNLIAGRGEPVYVPQYTTVDLSELTATVRQCFPEDGAGS